MDFIEKLAIGYILFAEDFMVYNYLIVFAAALIIGLVKTVDYRMQRATYFLNTALILVVTSVSQGIWLFVAPAIENDLLSVIVLFDISVWVLSAYALIIVTKARSNDAYGHARYAVLGFIPIANLWLLFTPSKDDFAVKLPSFFTGGKAVVLGLVLTAGGRGIGVGLEKSFEDYVENTTSYEASIIISDKIMSYYVSNGDIEDAILYRKSSENIGSRIDEVTVLKDIYVDNDTMEYRLRITDTSITSFTQQQHNIWIDYVCENYTVLIDAGATIIFHYYSDARPVLARIIGNTEVCT